MLIVLHRLKIKADRLRNIDERFLARVSLRDASGKRGDAEYLDEQTLFQRFRKVQDSLRNIPVTFDEITAEVEAVREEMHRARGR